MTKTKTKSVTVAAKDTREAWMQRAVELFRPMFTKVGGKLPARVHVSIGFPSNRALSVKKQTIGQCWAPEASSDKTTHLFISPVHAGPVDVLDTLCHELVHAAVGLKEKHRGMFKRVAIELGLQGKMTATHAGPALKEQLTDMAKVLGMFPHAGLNPAKRPVPPQTTRMLKIACPDCGYICRTTQKWIEEGGLPTCSCGTGFEVELNAAQRRSKKVRVLLNGD